MKQTYLIIVAVAVLGMAIITFAPATRKKQPTISTVTTESDTTASVATTATPTPTVTTAQNANTSTKNVAPVSTPAASSTGLKSGTFKGASVATQFGDVQVSISVSGGKITDVIFNTVPDNDRKSAQISDQASPILEKQTLAAQSSDISGVSGATYTTYGYIDSLQSAIDAAKG